MRLLPIAWMLPVLASAPAAVFAAEGEPNGKALFEDRCALCHRGSGPGVFMLERRVGKDQSILEERSNLTLDYIRTVARWGIGSMPRFTRGEINDSELEAIAGYLAKEK